MTRCTHCLKLDRYSEIRDADVFCALCGLSQRSVTIEAVTADAPGGGTRPDATAAWYVPDDKERPSLPLRIYCDAALPTRLDAIEVEPRGAAVVEWTPRTLQPDEEAFAKLIVTDLSVTRNLHLRPAGDCQSLQVLTIDVRASPKRLRATPGNDDGGATANVATGVVGNVARQNGQVIYQMQPLTLLPWSSGRCELVVRAADEIGDMPNVLPHTVRFEGSDSELTIRTESPRPAVFVIQVKHPDKQIETTLTFDLASADRQTVRLPLRVMPNREEWRWREAPSPEQPVRLPRDMLSMLTVRLERPGFNAGGSQSSRFRLDVRCNPVDAHVTVRPLRSPRAKQESVFADPAFQLLIKPLHEGRISLEMQLTAVRADGVEANVSLARRVEIDAVSAQRQDTAGERRVVVDFGTTNTCAAVVDEQSVEPRSIDLPHLARNPRRDTDILPTLLWLRSTADPEQPDVRIGSPAESYAREDGVLFREFKPELGNTKPVNVPTRDGKPGFDYTYTDLIRLFLRELLLEIRATTDHAPLDSFHITYPSTFSIEQRLQLNAAMSSLKEYGVIGEIGTLIDEANAGAFNDLVEHLRGDQADPPETAHAMIIDVGGGTIDVSLIRAKRRAVVQRPGVRRAGGGVVYDLQPLALTGIRDFAGKKITATLARILEEKLYAELYTGVDKMNIDDAESVPLQRALVQQPDAAVELRQAAASNAEAIREIAERIKETSYGRPEVQRLRASGVGSVDWYDKMADEDLLAELRESLGIEALQAPLLKTGSVDPYEAVPVDADTWERCLNALQVTRRELDTAIRPAIDELFDRIERMLQSVAAGAVRLGGGDDASDEPPPIQIDLLLMSGGSSCLPILFHVIEHRPEYENSQVKYDHDMSKRKVALGGAIYRANKNLSGKLQVRPPSELREYIMLPIGYRESMNSFGELFGSGERVPPGGCEVAVEYFMADTSELEIRVYESVDYRDRFWEPKGELAALGMTAPGKQLLARTRVQLDSSDGCDVLHRISNDPSGRRVLEIKYATAAGEQTKVLPL